MNTRPGFCMWTVRPDIADPWCGDPAVAERPVPPRQITYNGQPETLPSFRMRLCPKHLAQWDGAPETATT